VIADLIAAASAVAAVLGWLAARRATAEARKARLDPRACLITIRYVTGNRKRWILGPYPVTSAAGEAKPGTEFILPANGDVISMIGAIVILANEGGISALLRIPAHSEFMESVPDDEVAPNQQAALGAIKAPLPTQRGDGQWVIEPGNLALLTLRGGWTVEDLATTGGRRALDLTVEATDPTAAVADSWRFHLSPGAATQNEVLQPVYGAASHWKVPAWVPVEVTWERLARRYLTGPR